MRRVALIYQLAKVLKIKIRRACLFRGCTSNIYRRVTYKKARFTWWSQRSSVFGGVGTITTIPRVARYSIVGLKDIINFVLPHF